MDTFEGTPSNALLISNWSNAQIANYCDACCIFFSESVNDCLNHICILEKNRASSSRRALATSLEDCEI